MTKGAYAKLHHDMQHFVTEAIAEQLIAIKEAAPSMMVEYKLPIITVNPDGSLRGKGDLLEDEEAEFAKMLDAAGIDMIQVA